MCPDCVSVTLGLQNCCTPVWTTSGCSFPPDLGTKFVHTVSILDTGGREVGYVLYLVWGVYFIDCMSREKKAVNHVQARRFFFFQIDQFKTNVSSVRVFILEVVSQARHLALLDESLVFFIRLINF